MAITPVAHSACDKFDLFEEVTLVTHFFARCQRMQDWLMADDVSERIENEHQVDNLLLFIYIFLLILTILLIWLFKYIKINYIHETGKETTSFFSFFSFPYSSQVCLQ